MKKRILSIMLAACMVFTTGQSAVYAANASDGAGDEPLILEDAAEPEIQVSDGLSENGAYDYYVNPYAPAHSLPKSSEELVGSGEEDIPSAQVSSIDELISAYRSFMVDREKVFNITISAEETEDAGFSKIYNEIDEAVKRVTKEDVTDHTGVPYEGDYLRYQYGSRSCGLENLTSEENENGLRTYYFTYNFEVDYYSTREQEEEVTAKIGEVLSELNLDGLSNYYKVKAIHEYICTHTEYGNPSEDPSSRIRYTAYGALIEGMSVCQGYTNLFYRMCLEAGVDVRIVAGEGYDGWSGWGPHAWNIVKLGDLYYNVDATWDASYEPEDIWFTDYFLRGQTFFSEEHTPEDEFVTAEFAAAYPMSDEDYEPSYYDEFPDDQPSFAKASLILGGEIGVNFLMKLPNYAGVDYNDSYVEFTILDKDGNVTKDYYDPEERSNDGKLYKFTCYVGSIQMADTIKAVFHYNEDGNPATVENEYTVEEYIERLVAEDTVDEGAKELARSLANYGYFMQKYLSEARGWELGVDHAAMELCYAEDGYDDSEVANILSGWEPNFIEYSEALISHTKLSLSLGSTVSINVSFEVPGDFKGYVNASLDGVFYQAKKVGKVKYKAAFPDIPAHKLDTRYDIEIETANNDFTGKTLIHMAATDYVRLSLRRETVSETEKNAMIALYRYANAASNYVQG